MRTRIGMSLAAALIAVASLHADVKLPSIFSDNAVLQADKKVPVWGWADPGEQVTAQIGEEKTTVTADKDGNWRASLGPFKSGEKVGFTVAGNNKIALKNVIVGEVWLCSGQSNMAMTVQRSKDFDKEKTDANHPKIRMFKVTANPMPVPQNDCPGRWIICSADTVGGFTASGYFFGRTIHKKTGHPVGLVNSSVGGTAVEAWTSMDVQKDDPKLTPVFDFWSTRNKQFESGALQRQYERQLERWKVAAEKAKAAGRKPPRKPRVVVRPPLDRNHPSNLYNGMIAPLIPYAVRGALWYQGEHNARTLASAKLYRHQLPLLINDWRTRWGDNELPFLFVQLPNFKAPVKEPVQEDSTWALMRESMAETLNVRNTGMAITIDAGEEKDIHPKNKQEVGLRLARIALARQYKGKVETEMGPLYAGHKIQGDKVILELQTSGKLGANDDKELREFAIKGADGKWHPAKAEIIGATTLSVSSPAVKKPIAVRYAWKDNPDVNLFDGTGLPASPFRTDRK